MCSSVALTLTSSGSSYFLLRSPTALLNARLVQVSPLTLLNTRFNLRKLSIIFTMSIPLSANKTKNAGVLSYG